MNAHFSRTVGVNSICSGHFDLYSSPKLSQLLVTGTDLLSLVGGAVGGAWTVNLNCCNDESLSIPSFVIACRKAPLASNKGGEDKSQNKNNFKT